MLPEDTTRNDYRRSRQEHGRTRIMQGAGESPTFLRLKQVAGVRGRVTIAVTGHPASGSSRSIPHEGGVTEACDL
jgi:hypothetical protein